MKYWLLFLLVIIITRVNAEYDYIFPKDAARFLEGDLSDSENVRVLEYPGNKLKEISSDLGYLSNLRLLSLRRGAFTQIPDSLYKLKNLRLLDFHYANLLSLEEGIGAWRLMVSIQLEYNEMRQLPEDFGGLYNCRVLHLKGVRLKELPVSITKLQKLNFVHISASHEDLIRSFSNNLISINDDAQSSWAHYLVKRNIYIRNQQGGLPPKPKKKYELPKKSGSSIDGTVDLSLLNSDILQTVNIEGVARLILAYNQLAEIPKGIERFNQLIALDLSVNEIEMIKNWPANLNGLKHLSLASNCLRDFPSDFFSQMIELENLDLSNNRISTIQLPDQEIPYPLKELDLSGNEISAIPDSFSSYFSGLRLLVMYGNPIETEEIAKLRERLPNLEIKF